MVSQKIEEEMRIEADGAARGELEILKSVNLYVTMCSACDKLLMMKL